MGQGCRIIKEPAAKKCDSLNSMSTPERGREGRKDRVGQKEKETMERGERWRFYRLNTIHVQ